MPMKRGVWWLDRVTFRLQGREPQRFLNLAARQGVRLSRLCWEENGFSACAPGTARARIRRLAAQGGWKIEILERKGPGAWAERVLARPGLIAGAALFFVLLQWFGQLLWTIDFGEMEPDEAYRLRTLLAECGVYEGVRLEEETLESVLATARQQSDLFGWISLNFVGGCLFVERTEAQYQDLRQDVPMQALYAKESGEITAVEAESGFAAVRPGEQVEQGQPLVNSLRLDHDGDPVYQGASGKVIARIEKSYTATQPLRQDAEMLTGGRTEQTELYVLGHLWGAQGTAQEAADEGTAVWTPVRLGRLSLPACIRQETVWTRAPQTVEYSSEQARALARRACRDALLAEYPDAVIEAEQCRWESAPEGEGCTVTYRFCANIAEPGPATEVPAVKTP